MSDLYTEQIIKRKTPVVDQVKKIVLIALTVAMVIIGLIMPLFLIGAIVLGVISYFMIPRWNLEYEYLYVNGELDIDKIMSKTKRKRVCSLDLSNLELLAPVTSHQMDSYNNNPKIKTLDYSSMDSEHKIYAMILSKEGELKKVLFEPNEVMLNDIKRMAPRKVFFD